MKRTLRVLWLLLLLGTGPWALATHLVGGNLGYVYMGETAPGSQVYRYQIYMQFFMNCGSNSNFPTFDELLNQTPNHTLPVGVYLQDPLNPNADKQQQATVELSLVDSMSIVPDLPNNCTVGEGLCTLLGVFQGTVDLPLSFSGYHLYFQMCCRNLDIDNLNNPNGTGIGYYAFIPPTLVVNSSPVFLGIPTPFLCTSDTTTFVNSASDPDGDQLIFSFETPYNSVAQMGGIQPPPFQLPWPIPEITWNAGFSTAQPFGAGGYSFINGATGLTEYHPAVQGNYVVSVEVKEYRNGQLIGRTRRDLQLQAIPCPPNNTPQVSGSLPTSYTVNAGDSICFNMAFADIDVDSLTLIASGTIFDTNLYNPAATITNPAVGNGAVGAQFCWQTSCAEGQDQPYLFSVSVQDNGCPPKSTSVVFQVSVVPFIGPQIINGPATVCTQQAGSVYSTPDIAGATFAWTVNGGTIASGQGTNSITVNWGAPGPGSVLLSATNDLGCTSTPISVSVNIAALPNVDAGADATICSGASVDIGGSPTGPNGSSFAWTPSPTLNNAGIANPTATPDTTTSYIVQVSNQGCVNRDTVRVTISLPSVNAGVNISICTGDTAQLQANGIGNVQWAPPVGLSATNILNPLAFPTTTTDYVVTLTDSVTCIARDTVRVQVNQLPIVDAGADTSACMNETVVLGGSPTGPGGSTFTWTPGQGLDSTSASNPTATITATQTWTVTVADGNTCVNSDQVTVAVLAIPSVDAGPDTSVCSGGSVQLNGSGSGTLHWSPVFNLSDPDIGNPIASPEGTITYTLTVTGGNLCTNTDQTTVTVNVLPNANAGPDRAICLGDSVQIGVAGPGSFLWSPGATLSTTTIATPLAFPTIATVYTVTLTDSLTCSRSDSMMVTVNQPVVAGTDGAATSCSNGSPITLSALLGGNPDPNGTWSPSAVYTPGGGSQTFFYVVSGTVPCPNDTAHVTITEVPAPNAGNDAALSVCSADVALDLLGLLGASADTTGVWTDPIGGASNGTYIPGTSVAGTYVYVVPGSAPCANDTGHVAVVEVTSANAGTSSSVSICGSGTAFNLLGSLNGTPDAGGTWIAPDLTSHTDVFDPAVDQNGTYTYIAGFGGLCPDTAAVSVTITNPNVQFSGGNVICFGDTTQITGSGGTQFTWTPNTGISDPNIAAPLFYPTTTTTYTLSVTDASGCIGAATQTVTVNQLPAADAGADMAICLSQSTPIGGNPTGPTGSTFQWSSGSTLSDATAPNPTAQPASTTTYTVLVTDGNQCSAIDSVLVTVNPIPTLNAGNDTSFCMGGGVQLNATGTGQFAWSPVTGLSDPNIANPVASPAVTTTYTVSLTDGNACNNTDAIVVTVLGLPSVDAGTDRYLCPGFNVQLQGSGGGTPSWVPADSLSDAGVFSPLASPDNPTTYTLTITDGNGCSASDAMLVDVSTDPPIDAGADQSICFGQQVVLGGNPTSIPGTTFHWSPVATLSDTASANPTATPVATTLYTLIVSSDTCTSHDQVLVSLQGVAQAAFTVRLEPTCANLRAFFTDQSSGAAQWAWDFGDGSTSNEQYPQHLFLYEHDIVVTLTVTDIFGCTATYTQTYTPGSFQDNVHYEVPNVFTPNGDGKNDLFTIGGQPGEVPGASLGSCTSMFVFNRWGQKVFESMGGNLAWDGRNFAGEECIPGTYFYTLTVKDMNFNGDVYLNR